MMKFGGIAGSYTGHKGILRLFEPAVIFTFDYIHPRCYGYLGFTKGSTCGDSRMFGRNLWELGTRQVFLSCCDLDLSL